jgi:hypothetical protein
LRINQGLLGILQVAAACAVFLAGLAVPAPAQTVPLISKDEVKSALGSPHVVIADVRLDKDWNASEKKIKGAVRGDPEKVEDWAKKYQHHQDLILYCA